VLALPDVVEKLEQFGAEDGGGSPKRFGDFMKSERTKWAQIIKAGNVQPDS
jgi:tripartite-type tricarboxylate transporter receptor subunit TctC